MSLPAAHATPIDSLIVPTPDGIASRIIAKTPGGSVTVFAFDAGQGLSEHTSPLEALALVLDGRFRITIGGVSLEAPADTIVSLPASVPHAVESLVASRMLLIMLR